MRGQSQRQGTCQAPCPAHIHHQEYVGIDACDARIALLCKGPCNHQPDPALHGHPLHIASIAVAPKNKSKAPSKANASAATKDAINLRPGMYWANVLFWEFRDRLTIAKPHVLIEKKDALIRYRTQARPCWHALSSLVGGAGGVGGSGGGTSQAAMRLWCWCAGPLELAWWGPLRLAGDG